MVTWGVDVERDVLLGVLVRQVEQLRHEQVGNLVVDALRGKMRRAMNTNRNRIQISLGYCALCGDVCPLARVV